MTDQIREFIPIDDLTYMCMEPYTLLLYARESKKKLTKDIEGVLLCYGNQAKYYLKEYRESGNLLCVLYDRDPENLITDILLANDQEMLDELSKLCKMVEEYYIPRIVIKNDMFSHMDKIKKIPYHMKIDSLSPKMASELIKKFPREENLISILAQFNIELASQYEKKTRYRNSPSSIYLDIISFLRYDQVDTYLQTLDEVKEEMDQDDTHRYYDTVLVNALRNTDPKVTIKVYEHYPEEKVPNSLGAHQPRLYLPFETVQYFVDKDKTDKDQPFIFTNNPPESLLLKMKKKGYTATTRQVVTRRLGVDLKPLLEEYGIYVYTDT